MVKVVEVKATDKQVKTELKLDVKKSDAKVSEQNAETVPPEPMPSSQDSN